MKLPTDQSLGREVHAFMTAPPLVLPSHRPKMWDTAPSHDKAPLTPSGHKSKGRRSAWMMHMQPQEPVVRRCPPSLVPRRASHGSPAPRGAPPGPESPPCPWRPIGHRTRGAGRWGRHGRRELACFGGGLRMMPPHEEGGDQERAACSPVPLSHSHGRNRQGERPLELRERSRAVSMTAPNRHDWLVGRVVVLGKQLVVCFFPPKAATAAGNKSHRACDPSGQRRDTASAFPEPRSTSTAA